MIPKSSVLKKNAKAVLSGRWSSAVAVSCLLLSAMVLFLVLVSLFGLLLPEGVNPLLSWGMLMFAVLLSQFIIIPLLYGCLRWFWFVSGGADLKVGSVFYYFESVREYKRAVMLSLRLFFRIVGIMLVCFIPYILIYLLGLPETYDTFHSNMPDWVPLLWLLSGLLSFFGTIFTVVLLLRYFMAPILLINDESISSREALHMSVVVSRGSLLKYIGMMFSFIAWFAYCLLILPLIYVTPYYLCSYTIFCRHAIEQYNHRLDVLSNTKFPCYRCNF